MRRLHLFEFHDLGWYPNEWRNLLADIMTFFAVKCKPYRPIAPRLRIALEKLNCRRVIDLCSGAAGPVNSLLEELGRVGGRPVTFTLTDKYPNIALFRQTAAKWPDRISYCEEPVDATNVPEELEGFRTLFTSFHHFDTEAARGILQDAVRKRQGIGVFEYTERRFWLWVPSLLLTPVFIWLITPFIRPFRWRRLLWTYAIPVWIVFGCWDGLVSCLRTYSPQELEELTVDLCDGGYSWEIGRIRSIGACRVTYLLGVPPSNIA